MLSKTKFFNISIMLAMLLVTAAQCGTQPPNQEIQAAEDKIAAEHSEALLAKIDSAAIETLMPVELGPGEKLRVVATTTIIGDLVSNVGQNIIDLAVMLPPGSDPHTFEPTPKDAALAADAHIIFVNGLGLEGFIAGLIENTGSGAPVVALSTGVEPRAFEGSQIDPHVWMTPSNAIVMIHNIETVLSALDPANAETYAANAAAYQAKLEALDQWVAGQIAGIPPENREMVTDHDSFGYYADRYGLELVGMVIPAYSTNAEPSAQELAKLQDAISKHNAPAVFVGTTVNPVLARQLAEDMDIQLVSLYTGSLGQAGSGAETYIDFIRYNTTAIVEALM